MFVLLAEISILFAVVVWIAIGDDDDDPTPSACAPVTE